MKKLILSFLLISTLGFAEEAKRERQKPEPIVVMTPKKLASYDQETGEWELEKGANPKEVMTTLLKELYASNEKLHDCESAKKTAPKKAK